MVLEKKLCLQEDLANLAVQSARHQLGDLALRNLFVVDLAFILYLLELVRLDLVELLDEFFLEQDQSPHFLVQLHLVDPQHYSLAHVVESIFVF